MANRILWQEGLITDLATEDVAKQLGGVMEDGFGKKYRFVKNISATDLLYHGACLKALTSVLSAVNKYVRSTDTTTANTAQLSIPAGVPVTAIAKSGSTATGDHGWVQIAGPAKVSMAASDAANAASGWPGWLSIATNLPATDAGWDVGEAPTANSASSAYIRVRGVRIVKKFLEGTAGNARSAVVEVQCE